MPAIAQVLNRFYAKSEMWKNHFSERAFPAGKPQLQARLQLGLATGICCWSSVQFTFNAASSHCWAFFAGFGRASATCLWPCWCCCCSCNCRCCCCCCCQRLVSTLPACLVLLHVGMQQQPPLSCLVCNLQ